MRMDRLTVKAQEALQESQRIAAAHGHPEIRPIHLLSALVSQREGIVGPILEKLGVDPRAVAAAAEERLSGHPRVSGGEEPRPSR